MCIELKRIIKSMEDKYLKPSLDMVRRSFADWSNEEEAELVVRLIKEGLANCSAMNIRISLLPSRTNDISRSIKTKLDPEWRDKYGVSIASLGILPPTMTSESREAVAKLQKAQLAGE